jgi:hypothetical protein
MFYKPSTKQSIYLKEYQGLVINQAANFSVGANIGMIFMMAVEERRIEHGNQNISGYDDACALFINSCSSPSRNDFWWWLRNEFMLTKLLQQQKPIWV